MIFREYFSAYYRTVGKLLEALQTGTPTEKELQAIVRRYAFEESAAVILPALKQGQWQLLNEDLTTPIRHTPAMPLTLLEKRWLKAVTLDPRVRLFDFSVEGLEDVEPLFTPRDFRVFDRYGDGDPYEDETYHRHFRTALEAVKTRKPLFVRMKGRKGNDVCAVCMPYKLEYSEKDDKFRLLTRGNRYVTTLNLAKLTECRFHEGVWQNRRGREQREQYAVVLEIHDRRNAMERVMFHFAHFKKQAEKIGREKYRLTLWCDKEDDMELAIRILSFGPMVKVLEPAPMVELIRKKLIMQKNCGLI
ncbi:MAG: WYL domain-containing protein [Clostridia bacterium]|nr:WYL domain-containing protein [Clostridia bacterium]